MFDAEDLIFDQRTLEGLGNLYNSLVLLLHPETVVDIQQWFIKNLQSLHRIEAGGEWSPQINVQGVLYKC